MLDKTQNFLSNVFIILTIGSLFLTWGLNPVIGIAAGFAVVAVLFLAVRNKSAEDSLNFRKILITSTLVFICIFISAQLWFSLDNSGQDINLRQSLFTVLLSLGLTIIAFIYFIRYDNLRQNDKSYAIDMVLSGPPVSLSFCFGIILSSLLMIGLKFLGSRFTVLEFLATKFTERGIIPPISVFLFFMGAVLLGLKFLSIIREQRNCSRDLAEKVGDPEYTDSPIINYLREAGAVHKSEESISIAFDEIWNRSKSFYMIPTWINWSIPILGFLGTVLGISLASEGIAKIIGSPEGIGKIASDLGQAIYPLGIAFDTTLIALSLSLILVFFQTILQKKEERFLNDFENRYLRLFLN